MLKLIGQKLNIAVPPDNKNSGQSLAALIAEKANPVADVVYLGGQVGPQVREAGVLSPYKPRRWTGSNPVPPTSANQSILTAARYCTRTRKRSSKLGLLPPLAAAKTPFGLTRMHVTAASKPLTSGTGVYSVNGEQPVFENAMSSAPLARLVKV
jgi:ABC-type Fe3+ transport system substrate-binding protein